MTLNEAGSEPKEGVMTKDQRSVSATIAMGTSEYQEASWAAYERGGAMPDPSCLSDEALHAFLRYEAPELLLPTEATAAVSAESKRRGLSRDVVDHLMAMGLMAALGVGGIAIGWGLLAP